MNPISNSNQIFSHDAVKFVYQPDDTGQRIYQRQPLNKPFKVKGPEKSKKTEKDMKKEKGKTKQNGKLTPFDLMSGD
ncbi:MAG: hypothetical protein H0X29_05005 [Parachlamydiaceae bacterium]|nr:hypothetical protein [Parachlamydiaceae bacterium]